ncbi:MAG: sugar translocase [Acidimicrobiales bacterium]|nr:sugar translocase [Acidimicrobiales bacterium]
METLAPPLPSDDPPHTSDPADRPVVDIVVPVYNEADHLDASIRRLHRYLTERFPLDWSITVADNASTDRTWAIATGLAAELHGVQALHLDQKGRGRALRAAWGSSGSPVLAYMDVDLSTDLDALLPLVAPLVSGHSDVAIGTRLAAGAQVTRGPKREVISRIYNLLLRTTLRSGFSDAQCGFKAIRADVARDLLPLVEDQEWFFDTELLVLAEHNGLRIHEVPVDWVDDPDSRVDIVRTAGGDLRGIVRLLARLARGGGRFEPDPDPARPATVRAPGLASQLVRFASIGVVSTLVFGILFALLASRFDPLLADVLALAVCSVANTAANRRLTLDVRGRRALGRHHLAGLGLALLPLALTLSCLAVLQQAGVTSILALLVAATATNATGTVAKLTVLRRLARPTAVTADGDGSQPASRPLTDPDRTLGA